VTKEHQYRYIIAGAGSSGLSLAWHLLHSPIKDRSILIIDRNLDPVNDKTWCFWHRGTPPFKRLIHKSWSRANVGLDHQAIEEPLHSYPYHCIRSGTFRKHILEFLEEKDNVTLLEAPVDELDGNDNRAVVSAEGSTFTADYVFQSCFNIRPETPPRFPLIQHFLGWEVTAARDRFDPEKVTLMDFDLSYDEGLAFMYILPWSPRNALFEYTIFSREIEKIALYEEKLELYLFNKYGLKRIDYNIERTEYGEIPMHESPPNRWYAPRVLNIGVSAGTTKPSTGYTFSRIQNHCRQIVRALVDGKNELPRFQSRFRYRAYDLWLLQILYRHPNDAYRVFHQLFSRNRIDDIFRFLGEDTNLLQDLKIMNSVPRWPFLRAIWQTLDRLPKI